MKSLQLFLSSKKGTFSVFIFFVFSIFLLFFDFYKIGFLQDEWWIIAKVIHNFHTFGLLGFFKPLEVHILPLSAAAWYLQVKSLGLHQAVYGYIYLFIHAIGSLLVFIFFRKLLKNPVVAFIFGLIFLVGFNTTQTLIWIAVAVTYVPAFVFMMLFLIYFLKFENKQVMKWRDVVVLSVIAVLGLTWQESISIAFLSLPFFWLIFRNDYKKTISVKKITTLIVVLFVFMGLRFIAQSLLGGGYPYEEGSRFVMFTYNIFTLPLKIFVQSIFSLYYLWNVSVWYTQFGFPSIYGNGAVETQIMLEHVVLIFSIPIIIAYALLWKNTKDARKKKLGLFGIIWICACAVAVAPQGRHIYQLEFRYLYYAFIGVALLVYSFCSMLYELMPKKMLKLFYTGICLVALLYIFFSVIILRSRLPNYYDPVALRANILNQITSLYPQIPKKTVFYVTCKNVCAEGKDDLVLPFQANVGINLFDIYSQTNESAYAPLGNYLSVATEEGYHEAKGYGFGYFRDIDKIKEDIRKGVFGGDNVIALSYDKESQKITDITNQIRQQLKND